MPRTLSAGTIAALASGNPRFIVLVRIETPLLTLLMTSGTAPKEYAGETYTVGTLGGISRVRETVKFDDTGITIDFSGVDLPTLSVCASPEFINSAVDVWLLIGSGNDFAEFRADSTTVTADSTLHTADEADSVYFGDLLLFSGFTAGAPNISYGNESKITVNCTGKFAALDRPRTERYANSDQQQKYPGDLGMQYASTVSSAEVIWPAASWFKNQG